MKRLLSLFVVFLLSAVPAHAQSKEVFINAVYTYIVDTSQPYYLLREKSSPVKIDSRYVFADKGHFKIPEQAAAQLQVNSQKTYTDSAWNCYWLNKAKCVSGGTEDSLFRAFRSLYTKNSKYRKQLRKRSQEEEVCPVNIRLCDRRIYDFSIPVFDDSGTYAVIRMSYDEGSWRAGAFSCLIIFERVNNKWTLLMKLSCDVS